MKIIILTLLASLAVPTYGAACPFEMLKRAGLLSDSDIEKFEAVKRDPQAAEALFEAHRREAEPQPEPGLPGPASSSLLDLPLGGGLCKLPHTIYCPELIYISVNGVLQPLSGALAAIDIPTPQPQGLVLIPGDDPLHQFQAPGPTDVRGICPTLNTLANHGYISRDGVS